MTDFPHIILGPHPKPETVRLLIGFLTAGAFGPGLLLLPTSEKRCPCSLEALGPTTHPAMWSGTKDNGRPVQRKYGWETGSV